MLLGSSIIVSYQVGTVLGNEMSLNGSETGTDK